MTSWDVLIIGAGASGASAAFHLAKTGNKVALLEKNQTLEIKPCGGGIASSVQEWFPFDLKPAVDEVIRKVEFTWCLEDPVIANLSSAEPLWIVRREELDQLLIKQAIDAGATLFKPFAVSKILKQKNSWKVFSGDGKELESRSVIIADGSNSKWPKLFNLGPKKQHHASTVSVRLEGKGNIEEGSTRFEFGLVRHGFAWTFPTKKGLNVGIGTFLGKNSLLRSEPILEQLLPSLGFDPNDGSKRFASLRVWNGHSILHGDGILVIGDAASLCDPFLAEGLRPALMSGCEAAKCLNKWLKGDIEDLSNYTNTIKTRWGESMSWGKRISQIFYRFPKVGYQLGIKRPTASKRIAQILSGEMGYEDIAQRVIKRLLFKK